ncbi:MAG: DNA polymerase III subunit gamma/tau [Bacteroidota bacterium]
MAKKSSTITEGGGGGAELPAARPYVVLARKYRPQNFDDLIGQDAMVRTLRNAFAADRIAQGYMLTGVRGVGKTTTARILARALNYAKPGLADRPTTEMPDFGEHCLEIMESRHPDVLEMDAASNTGVDNIREIIESARYKPLAARFKVYVIDEVHMLSKGAFNALLKTLEEPPAHVKFIFATTEVRKVPVTVLSRCQRFDLRRVDVATLIQHFKRIVANEGWTAEEDALALIARSAEGSVRDGLSILDQAVAMGSGRVETAGVRAMLGLADRGRVFDLLEHVFGGGTASALEAFAGLLHDGGDPVQILTDMAEAVHLATRVKVAGVDAGGDPIPAEERRRARSLADRLSAALLSRAWQMLLKGIEEAGKAPDPVAAAEMLLIRMAHTADLPSPDEIIRALGGAALPARKAQPQAAAPAREGDRGASGRTDFAGSAQSDFLDPDDEPVDEPEDLDENPAPRAPAQPQSFADVVELAGLRRDARLKVHLEEHVSLVRFDAGGRIDLNLLDGAPREVANELREKLSKWTGRRWMVAVTSERGEPTIGETRRKQEARMLEEAKGHPAVRAVLDHFPGAKIRIKRSGRSRDDDQASG